MIKLMTMFPVLVAKDLSSLKAFYEQRFGFQTQFFDESFYLHMAHPDTSTQLAFMAPNHPSQPVFLHPLASVEGMVISFEVPDAQAAYDALVEAGLEITFDFKIEEFGVSHFMIKDPAGFVIDVVEHH